MVVLQAYQPDLLKELIYSEELNSEVGSELHQFTNLALCAMKQTASTIDHSMAALIAKERNLAQSDGDKRKEHPYFSSALFLPHRK